MSTPYDHQIAFLDALLEDLEHRQPRFGSTCETRTKRSVLGDRTVTSIKEIFDDKPVKETR